MLTQALRAPDIPEAKDLRSKMPPVYDQLALGSCTANAIGAAFEYEMVRQGETDMMPSRLFIYYGERVIEGTVNSDAGAEIRDGMKVIASDGVCPEAMWPYFVPQFRQKPSDDAYLKAGLHTAIIYEAVGQTMREIKMSIALGLPVIFGFSVYESFMAEAVVKTGLVPMPNLPERLIGGHAVLAVAYEPTSLIVRNSWGPDWGLGGHFKLPWGYVLDPNLASSFWVLQKVA